MSNTPNMSYCQFRNTLAALQQCGETLEALLTSSVEDCEDLPLSADELQAAKDLISQCVEVVSLIGDNISGSDLDLAIVEENRDELLDGANMLARRMRHSLEVEEVQGLGDCRRCGGTGIMIVANAENGPEFDSECPCDCAAGQRLIDESNAASDRERDEFERARANRCDPERRDEEDRREAAGGARWKPAIDPLDQGDNLGESPDC